MSKRRNAVVNENDSYNKSIQIKPKTKNQQLYLQSMEENIITFGIGVAGSGKSFLCLAYAAKQLQARNIQKIIITRPLVPTGNIERIGFLKGDLHDKIAPYAQPMIELLNGMLGKGVVESQLKNGNIEFKPLEYLRGTNFGGNDSGGVIVIMDESQNSTKEEMELFLTRIGDRCKVIINGDERQNDIHSNQSGLSDALNRLKNINSIGIVKFGVDDIVRSGMCKEIVLAYMK
jgi:phosphate starvation-inducible PhoH-like protein